jgi:hypothetical protein
VHSEDLACGEVGTPEVPKAGVNRCRQKSKDTCQQIMYFDGQALRKKFGVEETPKSRSLVVHLDRPLERTHMDRLGDTKDKYSERIAGREARSLWSPKAWS